ncbi:unnamed protein product [Cylindrotheca closterium]|uniref:DUF2470 domain-containing protein n=1 Tax=Cylindrotheca closterium TaxID=2856 RepID=A0AAD2CQ99_9STRA|nr:unnamed protein product [Cylindrotheca closterium]
MATSNKISAETSKRICNHMNEDHAATVYAMAISTLPVMQQSNANLSVSDARMTSISLASATIKFVTCSGDLCQQKQEIIPFAPPLSSAKESRPRLIEMHHQVLFPRLHWFYSDSFCAQVMVLTGLLIIAPIMAWNGSLGHFVNLDKRESIVYGLSAVYFTAHLAEAFYSIYLSQWKLKLGRLSSFCWFLMIFLAGLPITKKLVKLNEVQEEARQKAKKG